jgi:peroxiredoxin
MRTQTLHQLVFTSAVALCILWNGPVRAEIVATAEVVKPISKGAPVPDVTVKTLDGADFSLKKETADKLTVLIFYRGGWCPFCNRHLADIQKTQAELTKLGYRVLAISPDGAAELKATADKEHLTYTLLSDAELKAAEAFGLGFRLAEDTVRKYQEYGIKLTAKRDDRFVLPVPAVFLVGKDGKVAFAHYNPDYQKRLSGVELLKEARKLAGN